jgi:2-dehydro-3-deoxyphosphooctonate aldolase (KDO 8-P synthase)
MPHTVHIGKVTIGTNCPLALIAGPCVIESNQSAWEIASFLKALTHKLGIPFVFKASYDKANRTSIDSFRGPGLAEGLRILVFTARPKLRLPHKFWT